MQILHLASRASDLHELKISIFLYFEENEENEERVSRGGGRYMQ